MRQLGKINWLFVLLFLGTLSWSLTMVKSGLTYSFGLGFWGANGHDGIWHIALINSLAQGSFDIPTFAGEQLKNYHIGFDLLVALIKKITGIPTQILYFQILPPIFALLIGWLTYKFVSLWRGSKQEALWSLFFVYFGGSFGWILTLFRDGRVGGESAFWSQQAVSTLINPPFAVSLIFLLAVLIFLLNYEKDKSLKWAIFAVISLSLMAQMKIYAAVLIFAALGVVSLIKLIKQRNAGLFLITSVSVCVSAFLYLHLNKVSTNLLVFQPFWFLENMMALSDRVGWPRFYEAMFNYKIGGVWYKLIPAYFIAFAIFWFGNLGTRGIKEILVVRWIRGVGDVRWVEILISLIVVFGVLIPMLFLQKGTPWNTIQFLYYALFFSGILAGLAVGELTEKLKGTRSFAVEKTKKIILIFVLVGLTLPTTVSTLVNDYLPSRAPARVSQNETEALNFLKVQPHGVVLTYPYDAKKAEAAISDPPRPLYLYDSTTYVSAFSEKPVFLEDQVNLTIMDYNWSSRREEVEKFLASNDDAYVYLFLRDNNIKYIYWLKGQRAVKGESQLGVKRLFENKEVDIYQVD